jgi:hypothetical protein
MERAQLELLASLRVLIGYLGESNQFGWWPSNFFGSASKAFFSPIFARTSLLAQYHGITAAAAKVHNEHIGVGRVYHLFRLPEDLEHALHLAVHDEKTAASLSGLATDRESAVAALAEKNGRSGKSSAEGPIRAGDTQALRDPVSWQMVAGHYTTAFKKGTRSYSIWPERVREKCKSDKSLAIAHSLEELYQEPKVPPKRRARRTRKQQDEVEVE